MDLDDELFLLEERIKEADRLARRYEREGREAMMAGAPPAEVELRRRMAEHIREKIARWHEDEAALRKALSGEAE